MRAAGPGLGQSPDSRHQLTRDDRVAEKEEAVAVSAVLATRAVASEAVAAWRWLLGGGNRNDDDAVSPSIQLSAAIFYRPLVSWCASLLCSSAQREAQTLLMQLK